MTDPTASPTPRPRRRGRPALIDRERILAAARQPDPRTLTMKEVADTLGVDPTTLNYHVRGRNGLLQMLAADAFQTSFAAAALDDATDWRAAVRTFAGAIRDGVVATGALAVHFRFESDVDFAALDLFESTLGALVAGGFDLLDAARVLNLVGELADVAARRSLDRANAEAVAHAAELRDSLLSGDRTGLPRLRQLMEHADGTEPFDQFEFNLRILILGLEEFRTGPSSA